MRHKRIIIAALICAICVLNVLILASGISAVETQYQVGYPIRNIEGEIIGCDCGYTSGSCICAFREGL